MILKTKIVMGFFFVRTHIFISVSTLGMTWLSLMQWKYICLFTYSCISNKRGIFWCQYGVMQEGKRATSLLKGIASWYSIKNNSFHTLLHSINGKWYSVEFTFTEVILCLLNSKPVSEWCFGDDCYSKVFFPPRVNMGHNPQLFKATFL